MSKSLLSVIYDSAKGALLICPKCNNSEKNLITDFGSLGLCGSCRHVWGILDKYLTY